MLLSGYHVDRQQPCGVDTIPRRFQSNVPPQEELGGDTIADRLNADLAKYPPPVPPGKNRARGAWSRTSVYEILRNPKYTGYQVFNRRASRSRGGKVNDPVKWVWSPEPVHEPLIPKWMYDEINAHRDAKRGSRDGDTANKHPLTVRTNLFRSRIICGCGRRMYGCVRNKASYYLCQIRNNNRGRPDKYADHQKALYVREDAILDAVTKFFADRVFGQDRRAILAADLSGVDDRATQDRQNERERLRRQLDDIAQRQKSLLTQAQQGDPNDPFTKALRGSYNELEGSKSEALASIAELDEADRTEQRPLDATDIDLLDALPHLALNLAQAPRTLLGTLFDITQLRVELNHSGDQATITIRLPADQLTEVAISAERITDAMPTQNVPAQRAADTCVDAVRAPGQAPQGCTAGGTLSAKTGRHFQDAHRSPRSRWSSAPSCR
ncbi:recombinase family protein [Amycolatopsis japonica]|uniref:recombinase family protein n=1 Tax=Amycolatopsis japonica TaxID=208439 RepID=UPI003671555E